MARSKKLSERSSILLALIVEGTNWIEECKEESYWTPKRDPEWCEAIQEHTWVSGAGDANALKGLERKGLTKSVPYPTGYAFRATEEGKVMYQRVIWPEFEDRRERKSETPTGSD